MKTKNKFNLKDFNDLVKANNPLKYSEGIDKIVNIDEKIYNVEFYEEGMELKKGYAYIYGDYVLPFRTPTSIEPGLYSKSEDEIEIKLPKGRHIKKYSIGNIVILNPEFMLNNLSDNIEISNTVNKVTNFALDETDNALMKLLKLAINAKEIDINNYKVRLDNIGKSAYNNNMKPFKGLSSMTFNKFVEWCEVLDLEWKIVLKAKRGTINNFKGEFSEYSDGFED